MAQLHTLLRYASDTVTRPRIGDEPVQRFPQFIQGLETLPPAYARTAQNGAEVAKYLYRHAKVGKVIYPGVMDGSAQTRGCSDVRGYGGLVGFEFAEGGKEAARSS